MHQERDASYPSRLSQPLISAVTGQVGFSTQMSGNATNQELTIPTSKTL